MSTASGYINAPGAGAPADAAVAATVDAADATTDSAIALIKAALQRIGADDANNDVATTLVAADADGSLLERQEYLQAGLPGSLFPVTVTVVSSSIPNNTQAAGAITGAASGALILEDILIATDATGIVAPTNLEFSTDNVSGATGAGSPILLEAVAALGANVSESKKDATSHLLPLRLESGKKIFIHGDDAAGTGAGVATITMLFRRETAGATIAGVNLP